ncbi:metalloregulator ArsR/SmtB family transcription factor [Pedobacter sp. SG908]|uniref:metalloregulator ArsR/SmtB family transcription factor n=1 Tax=Pedobacter sp. SG908 TaxID=2587135 RepID=UPI001D97FCFA|nr:metalloregulator ArsR/SmtB family transcription factor [Pedobacter sp. SG908]NII84971.1 DNA-binding transcriptional ArsR family regulator [Pedobacter sp. SG908]
MMNLRRDVFQAIADPTRRAILLLVASQSITAGAIAANFNMAKPTVSKHLQILAECELLVQKKKERNCRFY